MFSLYNWHYAYKVALRQQQSKLVMHRRLGTSSKRNASFHAKRQKMIIVQLQESEMVFPPGGVVKHLLGRVDQMPPF